MNLSDGFSELEPGLREAGPSGRQLRYALLRHYSELVRHLTCSLASDLQGAPPEAAPGPETKAALPADTGPKAQVPEADAVPPHGHVDASHLHKVRREALAVFESCPLGAATYVALWIDAVPVSGRSLLLCLAVTAHGYRHVPDFADASLQEAPAVQSLRSGLRYAALCIMDGAKGLRRAVQDVFGSYAQVQRCTWHKRENVVRRLKKGVYTVLSGQIQIRTPSG